jgi:uncharacterized membrane protein (DUF2068 family)
MRGPRLNKYNIKHKFSQFKFQSKSWGYQVIEGAKQIFIPLSIFQLIRTIFFPTVFDVILLIVIFLVIIFVMLDWD